MHTHFGGDLSIHSERSMHDVFTLSDLVDLLCFWYIDDIWIMATQAGTPQHLDGTLRGDYPSLDLPAPHNDCCIPRLEEIIYLPPCLPRSLDSQASKCVGR